MESAYATCCEQQFDTTHIPVLIADVESTTDIMNYTLAKAPALQRAKARCLQMLRKVCLVYVGRQILTSALEATSHQ